MDCPTCGCTVSVEELDERALMQCPCCETVWLADDEGLDRILLGSEA